MDEKARYAIYRSYNGRCHHCGTRLAWEAFEVPGLSGGWVVEEEEHADKEPTANAYCYRCHRFEGRNKAARKVVIDEIGSKPTEPSEGDA